MKAFEYITELSLDGQFTLPPALIYTIHLQAPTRVRILVLCEEPSPVGALARFAGRWQDTRSAEEIVMELRADRDNNRRSDTLQW